MRSSGVVPMHVIVELQLQVVQIDEGPLVDEFLLQNSAGRFDDGVVVGVSPSRQGALDSENRHDPIDCHVVEFGAAIAVERLYAVQAERQRRECCFYQIRTFMPCCRMTDDLAIVQVDEQANAIPIAADAYIGKIAHQVAMRRIAVEYAVRDIGRIGIVYLVGGRTVSLLGAGTYQVVLLHGARDPSA